jgi:hypothetical protein
MMKLTRIAAVIFGFAIWTYKIKVNFEYSVPFTMIKSRRVRWTGHEAPMKENRNTYT